MSYSALDMDGYVIQSLLVAIGHLYLRTVLVLPVQAFFLWCAAKDTSGGYCGGVPPLPIPNREVKPTCADGTAMQCGRVGSRLLLQSTLKIHFFRVLFSFYIPCECLEIYFRML